MNNGEKLAEGLRAGDAQAVQEVRTRIRRILAFRGYGIPEHSRLELEQEIVTQIWQAVNRSSFDPQGGFWGFVEVVASRRCIDWRRSRKPVAPLEGDFEESAPGPLRRAAGRELAHAVLAQLGKPCRDLIYLHVGMGHSYRDLEPLLGKSEGALRVQMHRCVQEARRIRDQLEAAPGPHPVEQENG